MKAPVLLRRSNESACGAGVADYNAGQWMTT